MKVESRPATELSNQRGTIPTLLPSTSSWRSLNEEAKAVVSDEELWRELKRELKSSKAVFRNEVLAIFEKFLAEKEEALKAKRAAQLAAANSQRRAQRRWTMAPMNALYSKLDEEGGDRDPFRLLDAPSTPNSKKQSSLPSVVYPFPSSISAVSSIGASSRDSAALVKPLSTLVTDVSRMLALDDERLPNQIPPPPLAFTHRYAPTDLASSFIDDMGIPRHNSHNSAYISARNKHKFINSILEDADRLAS